MPSQCNPINLCVRQPKKNKRINVKPSIKKKKKNFDQQTKYLACVLLESLL